MKIRVFNPVAASLLSREAKVKPSVVRSRKAYTRKGRGKSTHFSD